MSNDKNKGEIIMHFTVAVFSKNIEDVENLLAPFNENDRSFYQFIDKTVELKSEYFSDKIEAVRCPDGKIRYPWDEIFRIPGTIGVGSITHKVPEDQGYIIEKIPVSEIYNTFEKYCKDYYSYIKTKDGKYGSYNNPNSIWDWYEIGGRWSGLLLVKENLKDHEAVTALKEIKGYIRVDSAKVKDIEWDKMKEVKKFTFSTFAVITSDGKLHGGFNIEEDQRKVWNDLYFDTFIRNANPEEFITIVDCHV
jgi:hypothetical protein